MSSGVSKSRTPFENVLKLINNINSPNVLATDVEFLWPQTISGSQNTSITVSALPTGRFPGTVQCTYNRLVLSKNPVLLAGTVISISSSATLDEAKATVIETLGLQEDEIIFYYAALPTWGTTYWSIGCLWNCLIYSGTASIPVKYK